jgi:hypothetical protein
MKQLAAAVAAWTALALGAAAPAAASIETEEAKTEASLAAAVARDDMLGQFDDKQLKQLKPGKFVWKDSRGASGPAKVVISLSDQLAYLYRGDQLVAVSTISTGRDTHPTPTGIFNILEKRVFYRSIKYENAPMPHMQRIDQYGIALHGGALPGYPASHGCIRLPPSFAAKLFGVTPVGTPVLIGS